jgi:hypothetical protein
MIKRAMHGVINPLGEYVAGPLLDDEGIVYAEIDLREIVKRKCYIDPVGKDSRWDVIRLDVGEGHFSPSTKGFPAVKKESEQAVRFSKTEFPDRDKEDELRTPVVKLTEEVARLKGES